MMTQPVKTITKPVTVESEDHLQTNTHPDMLYGLAITYGQPSVASVKGRSAHDRFLSRSHALRGNEQKT